MFWIPGVLRGGLDLSLGKLAAGMLTWLPIPVVESEVWVEHCPSLGGALAFGEPAEDLGEEW